MRSASKPASIAPIDRSSLLRAVRGRLPEGAPGPAPETEIVQFDTFGEFNKILANPGAYGFEVTDKALDGLYLMIGEEERKIRADPVGTGSAILKKVFGSLK